MNAFKRYIRADSGLAPSQLETSLQSNAVSHWLGANLELAMYMNDVTFVYLLFHIGFDPCDNTPCMNNATCVSVDATYTCTCSVGYTGSLCETSKRRYPRELDQSVLTQWGRDKMAPILQITFSIVFTYSKTTVFWLTFYWNIFAMDQLFQIRSWGWKGYKPLSNPVMTWPSLLSHICVTRLRWVNRSIAYLGLSSVDFELRDISRHYFCWW